MKRIFAFIIPFILLSALCGYLFGFEDYNFFRQLSKVSLLPFPNPLKQFATFEEKATTMLNSYDFTTDFPTFVNVNSIEAFFKNVGSFFAYIGSWFNIIFNVVISFFKYCGLYLEFIGLLIYDFFADIYYGLSAILIILGFPVEIFLSI